MSHSSPTITETCLDLSQLTRNDEQTFAPQKVSLIGHQHQVENSIDSSSDDSSSESTVDSEATTIVEEEQRILNTDQEVPHLVHNVFQDARDAEFIDDFLRDWIMPQTPWFIDEDHIVP